jgi:hypothetical protein
MSKTSYRENIAKDVESTLRSIKSVKFVSREIFEIDELSDAQFPAILVQTGSEIKSDQTIALGHNRLGTIEYVLTGFVKGKYLDTARNKLTDEIETQLYLDVTRNGYAIDTLVTEVNTDEGVLFPLGAIQMIVRIEYYHQAGELDK